MEIPDIYRLINLIADAIKSSDQQWLGKIYLQTLNYYYLIKVAVKRLAHAINCFINIAAVYYTEL